jgi:hypothetical protein
MQDFANYRTDFHTESPEADNSLDWSLDFTSMTIGIILGVGVCLIGLKIAQIKADQAALVESPVVLEEVEEKSFVFEFYEALKSYEVLPKYR